jgi:hypothetical protein
LLALDCRPADPHAAFLNVAWPERELLWHSCQHATDSSLFSCSLLAAHGGDDADAESALLRRLRPVVPSEAVLRVVLATAQPLPLLSPHSLLQHDLRAALETLRTHGVVLDNAALSPDTLSRLQALAASQLASSESSLRARGLRPFQDDLSFADVASRSRGRLELRLPLRTGDTSQALLSGLASHGPWASLVRAALRPLAAFLRLAHLLCARLRGAGVARRRPTPGWAPPSPRLARSRGCGGGGG